MRKKPGEQFEFDFYIEMKKEEKYRTSYSRMLWDKNKPFYEELISWTSAGLAAFGFACAVAYKQEIGEYIRNLF